MKVRSFSSLLLACTSADLVFLAALRERCSGYLEGFHSLLFAAAFVFPGLPLPKFIDALDAGQPGKLGEASRDTSSEVFSGCDDILLI